MLVTPRTEQPEPSPWDRIMGPILSEPTAVHIPAI